jgi:hypothetical protein
MPAKQSLVSLPFTVCVFQCINADHFGTKAEPEDVPLESHGEEGNELARLKTQLLQVRLTNPVGTNSTRLTLLVTERKADLGTESFVGAIKDQH